MHLISINMSFLNFDYYNKCLDNTQFNFDNIYILHKTFRKFTIVFSCTYL